MKIDVKFKNELSQNLYFIRGIAIVLVVIGHVIGYNNEYGMRQLYDSNLILLGWLCDFINTFQMPLFFICSGVAFAVFSNKNVGYKNFIHSKFEKLIIPLIFWSPSYFIFQAIYQNKSFSFFKILNSILYPSTIFWFLHALIFATLFAFICFKILKKKVYFLLSIILFILSFSIKLNGVIYLYFYWNIFYAFGVLISNYLDKISLHLDKLPLRITLITELLCMIIMLTTKIFSPIEYVNYYKLINGITAFLLFYVVVVSSEKIKNSLKLLTPMALGFPQLIQLVKNNFVYLGKMSMAIYLFHGYFTRGIIILLIKLFGVPNQVLYFLLVSSGGVLLPILLYRFLQTRSKIFVYSIGGTKQ